jgi:hypothetical protein
MKEYQLDESLLQIDRVQTGLIKSKLSTSNNKLLATDSYKHSVSQCFLIR